MSERIASFPEAQYKLHCLPPHPTPPNVITLQKRPSYSGDSGFGFLLTDYSMVIHGRF